MEESFDSVEREDCYGVADIHDITDKQVDHIKRTIRMLRMLY